MVSASPEHPKLAEQRPIEEQSEHDHEHEHPESWIEWLRVGLVAAVLLVVWSGVVPRPHGIDWLALAGIAVRRLSDLQRSDCGSAQRAHDHGTLHDHRPGGGFGDRRVLYRSSDHRFRADR